MNVLLIDDHQMTLEGYVVLLKHPKRRFYKALDAKEVYDHLQSGLLPDVALIDYNIPYYAEQNLFSGADCAVLIKKYAPLCKIILITAHDEALTLHNIYHKIHPNALIVKGDFTTEMIKILMGNDFTTPFLSGRAKEALQEVRIKQTLLSPTNIEILMYLSQGFKINELEKIICLTKSTIQKRITKMLCEFQVKDYQELIRILKKN